MPQKPQKPSKSELSQEINALKASKALQKQALSRNQCLKSLKSPPKASAVGASHVNQQIYIEYLKDFEKYSKKSIGIRVLMLKTMFLMLK